MIGWNRGEDFQATFSSSVCIPNIPLTLVLFNVNIPKVEY